jgi:signal transduction histidine kinase
MQVISGLRFRLLLLVLLVCAPLVVLVLHNADEDRHRAMENWQRRSAEMLQIAHGEELEMVNSTRQLLLAISEASAIRSPKSRRCADLLREQIQRYPRYSNLGILTTNGELVASAVPTREAGSFSGRDFCQTTVKRRGLTLNDFPARSPQGTPVILFGYPVLDRTGRGMMVVFAEMNRPWFSRLGSDFPVALPKEATWTEIDEAGRILFRYPPSESQFADTLPERFLLPSVLNSPTGVVEHVDAKGVSILYAYHSRPSELMTGGVISILGIPRQVLFSDADHLLERNLSLLAVAAAAAFALGWVGSKVLVLRPVQALVRSTARLAAGDLTVRTGLPPGRDELGQLTRAFDDMVQTLEQREAERQRATQKLQLLSHRLVEVQESERRHIARELHDEIGQSLTAAELNLQAALQLPGNPALEKRLEESIQAVERVLEQVQDLSLSLRPSMLDDLGLEPALRSYTYRQAELTGMKAEFKSIPLGARLDSVIETECFRVAQEALTNVVRHAEAGMVKVELSQCDGHLYLSVRDDGKGFDVNGLRQEALRGESLGLLSMEERAALVGGGIQFKSVPGEGTLVQAWFPLKWRADSALCETNHA